MKTIEDFTLIFIQHAHLIQARIELLVHGIDIYITLVTALVKSRTTVTMVRRYACNLQVIIVNLLSYRR